LSTLTINLSICLRNLLKKEGIKFRIVIRIPEIFYVLRNHESKELDRFDEETKLIKKYQSDEEEIFSTEVQLGRDQIDKLYNILRSIFKNYVFNLESDSKDDALLEVKTYLEEMRNI
jgi:hypothetical protein